MSDWAKTLLADVARECDERCIFHEEYVAVLGRRLLGLLEAGEAMREFSGLDELGDDVCCEECSKPFRAWDAAKAKASQP